MSAGVQLSAGVGDELECFHFQEWTYREMRALLQRHGFRQSWIYFRGAVSKNPLINTALYTGESSVSLCPRTLRKKISRRILPAVTMMAIKE